MIAFGLPNAAIATKAGKPKTTATATTNEMAIRFITTVSQWRRRTARVIRSVAAEKIATKIKAPPVKARLEMAKEKPPIPGPVGEMGCEFASNSNMTPKNRTSMPIALTKRNLEMFCFVMI